MVLLAKMLWWCFFVLMKDMAWAVITHLATACPNRHVLFLKAETLAGLQANRVEKLAEVK